MRKRHIVLSILILSLTFKCWGQTDVKANSIKSDTLKINTFTINLDFLFYLTHKEMNSYPDLKAINMAQVNVLLKETEIGLYFRQILDRLDNGYFYYNTYVNLSSGLFKYKFPEKNRFIRILYPEPVFIFQNNAGRALSQRFQTGLFLYPIRYFRPNVKINLGIGCLRDWSSWKVNSPDLIEACPPDMKEKILFVNSHSSLRKGLYMDFSEWRPTLCLIINYQINDIVSMSLFSSYQQSLVSPFNQEIKDAYPELRKVYPYTYSQLSVGVRVYKQFAVKSSFILDYENNNPSIYASSWEYCLTLGLAWNFSGKQYLPVTLKAK